MLGSEREGRRGTAESRPGKFIIIYDPSKLGKSVWIQLSRSQLSNQCHPLQEGVGKYSLSCWDYWDLVANCTRGEKSTLYFRRASPGNVKMQ